ncbi:MAG: Asp23/Gls24 family envelope stress response protein [Clostridia bacterium]|nr:Asp23/Gls24 family envelope stress response protein [Clostridia bacterium]
MSEEFNEVISTLDETEDKVGNVKISVDVIAKVASIATTDIKGISGMSTSVVGDLAGILSSKKKSSKGVKVEVTDDSCVIDVFIIVDYGVKIPDIAWEVQESVKNNVESMTGMTVSKVNIHVEGINFEKDDKKAAEVVADEEE